MKRKSDTLIVPTSRSAKLQSRANRRLDELMLIARLWPRESAWVDMDFGRPTLERNHLRKIHHALDPQLSRDSQSFHKTRPWQNPTSLPWEMKRSMAPLSRN